MCWSSFHPIKKVAEKDIIVYKVLNVSGKSYYKGFCYEKGKLYSLNKQLKITNLNYIKEGFHSYSEGSSFCWNIFFNTLIVKSPSGLIYENYPKGILVRCVVPKGSEYYVNKLGEVVSNKIIVYEQDNSFSINNSFWNC